jgi:aquaporin Z
MCGRSLSESIRIPVSNIRESIHSGYAITFPSPKASIGEVFLLHWREYVMEGVGTATLLLNICLAGTLLYSPASPSAGWSVGNTARESLMGFSVALSAFFLIRSPLGRRSGAHFNPAVTLSYLYLRKINRWDALLYVAVQFAGATFGVLVAAVLLGNAISASPVSYMVTLPSASGEFAAFCAELLLAYALMMVLLLSTNSRRVYIYAPVLVGFTTISYFVFCSSVSGFSVNPARSFASALFAELWRGFWIYLLGPVLGAIAASHTYARVVGARVYCAKVCHDAKNSCPFDCQFHGLVAKGK